MLFSRPWIGQTSRLSPLGSWTKSTDHLKTRRNLWNRDSCHANALQISLTGIRRCLSQIIQSSKTAVNHAKYNITINLASIVLNTHRRVNTVKSLNNISPNAQTKIHRQLNLITNIYRCRSNANPTLRWSNPEGKNLLVTPNVLANIHERHEKPPISLSLDLILSTNDERRSGIIMTYRLTDSYEGEIFRPSYVSTQNLYATPNATSNAFVNVHYPLFYRYKSTSTRF